MNTSQWLLLEIIGMLAAPFAFALIATLAAWRSTNQRALFLVFAVLAMCGLSAFIFPIAQDLLNPSKGGPATYPSAQFNVLLAHAVSVAVCGFPLLLWLHNALRRI